MPSTKPVIALRLEPALYERLAAAARQEGRSLANFAAYHLGRLLGPPASGRAQIDLVDELANAKARQRPRGGARAHK